MTGAEGAPGRNFADFPIYPEQLFDIAARDPSGADPHAALANEILAGIQEEGSVSSYLNNFSTKLDGVLREWWMSYGSQDKAAREAALDRPLPVGADNPRYSELFRRQPLREFFAAVDQAVEDAPEVDAGVMVELYNVWQTARREGSKDAAYLRLQWGTYVLPVYFLLRLRGYYHEDLVV